MAQEKAYLANLQAAATYKIDGEQAQALPMPAGPSS